MKEHSPMSKTTILRPLTADEVRTIAIALSTSIARDGDKVGRTSGDLSYLYNHLRTAAESLAAIADYACNNLGDDEPATPGRTAAAPSSAPGETHA